MSTVIKVENLGKRYRLGEINRKLLYEELQSRWARFRGKNDPHGRIGEHTLNAPVDFWALQGVSFDVKDGEVLGVIGRNGAGKSTLLKVLSRITAPTEGRVLIKGRVASLLEVGTGFKSELTGRENVYLNGAILGMSHREVKSKFDEIAAFSGVEKFIDTPVKRYSSGMQVRLGFAVAAHLDPEILIIDEVLAVGDAAFRQKCLTKIGDVARQGRTVLFVSHNMAAVENLCTSGLVLDSGRLDFSGTQTDAILHYLQIASPHEFDLRTRTDRIGSGEVRINAIEFRDTAKRKLEVISSGQEIDIYLHFETDSPKSYPNLVAGIVVKNMFEVAVFAHYSWLTGEKFGALPSKGAFICRIKSLPLPATTYKIGFGLTSSYPQGDVIDSIDNAIEVSIEPGDFYGTGHALSAKKGVCLVEANWRLENTLAMTTIHG